jgi:hypothetical protein
MSLLLLIIGIPMLPNDCGWFDTNHIVGCEVDNTRYGLYRTIAAGLWFVNRSLLVLVHQLEQIRVWIVDVAFQEAYKQLSQVIDPWLSPLALIAVLLGCLLFLAMPLFGRSEWINVRQAIVWAALGPMLLAHAGQALASVEQFRWEIGATIFAAAQIENASPLGTAIESGYSDLNQPTGLYPNSNCGTAISRPVLAGQTAATGFRMDDLAASMLFADAVDLHCPYKVDRGTPPDLPHGLYREAPLKDKQIMPYVIIGSVRTMQPPEREAALKGLEQATIRMAIGLIPSILAVVEGCIQLLLSLSLVAIWVAGALTMLIIFFQRDLAALAKLVRSATSTVIASWTVSFLIGLIFAGLMAAARSGSAATYTGFAIGGLLVVGWLLGSVITTFTSALTLLSNAASEVGGMALNAPLKYGEALARNTGRIAKSAVVGGVAGVAGVAGGVASGVAAGGKTLAAGAIAAKQSGSLGYGVGAAMGRIRPLAAVGGAAAAMGCLPEHVGAGIQAGEVGKKKGSAAQYKQTAADLKTLQDENKTTFAERKRRRQLARQAQPALRQRGGSLFQRMRPATPSTTSNQKNSDTRQPEDVFDALQTVAETGTTAEQKTPSRQQSAKRSPGGRVLAPRKTSTKPTTVRPASTAGHAMRASANGKKLERLPKKAENALPTATLYAAHRDVDVGGLLAEDWIVQPSDDGNGVYFWKVEDEATSPNESNGADQLQQLERQLQLSERGVLKTKRTDIERRIAQVRRAQQNYRTSKEEAREQ